MKKIKNTSELLWVFGILFVAFGVAICSKTDLGVSMIAAPTFVVSEALVKIHPFFSVGVVEYLLQAVILLILSVVVRRFKVRFLLVFAVSVIYGYTLNFFLWILREVVFDTVLLRWVMLLVGDLIIGLGVACFFRTYLPLQAHELFVKELTLTYKLNLDKTKWIFDISLLVISISLALLLFGDIGSFDLSGFAKTSFHSIGLGTLVTTVINSPIITLMGRLLDRITEPTARFPKLEKWMQKI